MHMGDEKWEEVVPSGDPLCLVVEVRWRLSSLAKLSTEEGGKMATPIRMEYGCFFFCLVLQVNSLAMASFF